MPDQFIGPERSWRVTRTQSRRWIVERVARDMSGQEVREISAIYPTRDQAEKAITRAMRLESRRWRPG